MAWGTHCPSCGEEECRWVAGKLCEGKVASLVPPGYRIDVFLADFGSLDHVFSVSERVPRMFGLWHAWQEIDACRANTPRAAAARLKKYQSVSYRRP